MNGCVEPSALRTNNATSKLARRATYSVPRCSPKVRQSGSNLTLDIRVENHVEGWAFVPTQEAMQTGLVFATKTRVYREHGLGR